MLKNSPKTPYLIIVILVGVFAFLYFSKPSGHKQEVERLQGLIKKYRNSMDSSRDVAEAWRLKALEYGNQQREDATRAMKAEQRLNYALEENQRLKTRIVRYSNAGLDSVFSARYGN